MKWPDVFGLAVWLPALELLYDGGAWTIPRSHDRDVSRASRCLPGVPTLLCTDRMHACIPPRVKNSLPACVMLGSPASHVLSAVLLPGVVPYLLSQQFFSALHD